MKYNELNERYYSLFGENLPFSSEDFEPVNNKSDVTNRMGLLNYYELRYDGPSNTDNDRDHDFVSFLNTLGNRSDENVACLLVLAKKHHLTFVFNVDYSELIYVFPIRTWKILVEQDGNILK